MKLIRVTSVKNGKQYYINPAHILSLSVDDDGSTKIQFPFMNGNHVANLSVKESVNTLQNYLIKIKG